MQTSSPDKPDSDEEWNRWVSWLGEGAGGPSIDDDVIAMLVSRQVWDAFRLIRMNAPTDVQTNDLFYSWVQESYVRRQALAIRRQVDLDSDVISLARLIDRVRKYPHVLSREHYVMRTAEWLSREEADRFFDAMIGEGRSEIDPNVARADLAKLKDRTALTVNWVKNEVAHYNKDKGSFGQGLTFEVLNASMKLILDLFAKYRAMILGSSMSKTVSITPWTGPFTVAWIPDRDHHQALHARIAQIERKREEGTPLDVEEWLL